MPCLAVYLTLALGEAHDNRPCSVLLGALLLADRGYDAGTPAEYGAALNLAVERGWLDS